ncbi:MAG TPA: enoyl-CoA hydratase/isomerase family protein [Solirubrobacteraceae bacterium]|nr:enoyl-CoA hydratase/isomerase family protein [Solirubrobacteraceae bacterium]
MTETRISVSHDDGLAHLVMDYAPVNQFNTGFLQEISAAVSGLADDTRALVVSSAVPGIFAAGGDLPWMASATIEEQLPFVALCQDTYSAFERLSCPVVVAIDGHCLGGGLEMSLCCDIRVVGESARLGLPEATIGLLAAAGGTQRLVRAVGQGVARDMLLTGLRITGAQAGSWGIVSRVVSDGQAEATALEIGRALADGPAEAIQATKRLAVAASELDLGAGLARERAEWEQARRSASTQEGLEAFAEKRRPDFARARAGG